MAARHRNVNLTVTFDTLSVRQPVCQGVCHSVHFPSLPTLQQQHVSVIYVLHNSRRIRLLVTQKEGQVLVQDQVGSHLDHCNSLLVRLPASATRPLQLTQIAAAGPGFNLNPPTFIRSLHWLPVVWMSLPGCVAGQKVIEQHDFKSPPFPFVRSLSLKHTGQTRQTGSCSFLKLISSFFLCVFLLLHCQSSSGVSKLTGQYLTDWATLNLLRNWAYRQMKTVWIFLTPL